MKRFILLLTLALLVLSFFFYEEVVCALRPHIPFNRSSTHTWSEIGGSQAVKPTIHAIIAADGSDKRHGIIENIVTDYENMERLFRRNVPESQLNLVLMDMDEITPDKILEAVKQIVTVHGDLIV